MLPDEWLGPGHCVLLVVDLQRWYVEPTVCPFPAEDLDWPGAALMGISSLVEAARAGGVPVAWTRTVEGAPTSPPILLERWDRAPEEPRLLRGSVGWEWTGVRPAADEFVVDKVWPDACTSEPLVAWLGGRSGLRAVVLVGAYAARCVLASAFGLARLGYEVLVPDGLIIPHPARPDETDVAQQVIATTLGYVVEPDEVAFRWSPQG